MTSSKFARIHNRILKQRKYQNRNNNPIKHFIKFVNSNKLFENCCCDRGMELVKEMLKHNQNIKQVAYKVDEIISDELYEIYLQNHYEEIYI